MNAPSARNEPGLSVAEQVCLALVVQRVSHGWAIGSVLAPEGEVGRVWTLSRPLTYRAIDGLVDKGMVVRGAPTTGSGRERSPLTATAPGKRASRRWLDQPIEHLRDVRTELLAKLVLRDRAGLDPEPLLRAQAEVFAPAIDALTSRGEPGDLVDLWRRESARAVRRFLDSALRPFEAAVGSRTEVRLSARNQLHGRVAAVVRGEVMATIRSVLPDGQTLTATITRDAADDLDLAAGDDVLVIVKSTEVMVAKLSGA
jgi:molybdopterin-binding protein